MGVTHLQNNLNSVYLNTGQEFPCVLQGTEMLSVFATCWCSTLLAFWCKIWRRNVKKLQCKIYKWNINWSEFNNTSQEWLIPSLGMHSVHLYHCYSDCLCSQRGILFIFLNARSGRSFKPWYNYQNWKIYHGYYKSLLRYISQFWYLYIGWRTINI